MDGSKDKTMTREVIRNKEGENVLARNVKKKTDNVSVISTPEGVRGSLFVILFLTQKQVVTIGRP